MQASWLFNYSGKPWLTQKYTRAILNSYYGDEPYHGWEGDEDEGQQAETETNDDWCRHAVEVMGVGIDAARKPSEDGAVTEQMDDSKKNHSLACDCHQNFSAD